MKDIEFRAKAINREEGREYRTNYKNGDWVYGLITQRKNQYTCATMTNIDGVSNIDVDDDTLGQYTGHKDKKGVKIYEGDILNSLYRDDGCEGIYVIEFADGRFYPRRYKKHQQLVCITMRDLKWCEVIGNIYDNPELLEGV